MTTVHSGMSFNLIDVPWILVQRRDGPVEEVSLLDLFARAHELRGVVGEVPTQTFAITRLLLAILRRALDGPRTIEDWARWWRAPTLPIDEVRTYLEHFRHRFDLLSPETPFYQVADLRTAKGEFSGLEKLIADVPVGAPYFTTRLGSGIARISFAEAARWVVHCQAFDPSGIKSGALGDPRVKGGKGYPIGTGWAGMLGGILVEGQSLRETLLLHLIPDSELADVDLMVDLPVWERPPDTAAQDDDVPVREGLPEKEDPRPSGPCDLYTWQSRRIRLFCDADGVYGVLIANGDRLTPQNRHPHEPMSAWRRSTAQEKKHGGTVYMPREHDPERSIWRGLEAILTEETSSRQGSGAAPFRRPEVLTWISTARDEGVLEERYQIRTRAIGMLYGSQSSTTAEIIDDAVSMPAQLLAEAGRELRATVLAAVVDAEEGADALGNLAANLATASGGDGASARDQARRLAYATLDRPYRRWLASLNVDTPALDERRRWQHAACYLISRLGKQLVEQAGPGAWRGRRIDRGKGEVWDLNTATADSWFRNRLRRIYPYAYETRPEEVAA